MKTIKHALLAIAASTFSLSSFSQIEKTLRFIPEDLDFGYIRESDGEVTKSVKAVNISKEPTFIISARTSCGCSEAKHDAKTIAPGDTTIVSITYDPTNRPGKFRKTAKVFTGKERISNTFHITGTVIPSEKHLDNTYPEKVEGLRFSTKIVNANNLKRTEIRPIYVGVYNDSSSPVTLDVESDSDALEVKLQPATIDPYGVATICMMLRGSLINKNTTDFKYNIKICNPDNGREIYHIPVGGMAE